jgi:hypothetical protein
MIIKRYMRKNDTALEEGAKESNPKPVQETVYEEHNCTSCIAIITALELEAYTLRR